MKFGEADVLSRAKNTSVSAMADMGLLNAGKGHVRLLGREELPDLAQNRNHVRRCLWLLTQHMVHALEKGGIQACAELAVSFPAETPRVRDMTYRLFSIADRKGWAGEANAYNALVVSWPEIQEKVMELKNVTMEQGILN